MATIAQILPRLESGGVERGTIEIAKAIVNAGHQAVVISQGGAMVSALDHIGARHVCFDVACKNPFSLLSRAKKLAGVLLSHQVDLVDTRSRVPAWIFRASFLYLSDRPLWVSSYHGIHKSGNALKRYYNSIMIGGDQIVAVSEAVKEHIDRHYPKSCQEKLHVIPRGCDVSLFFSGQKSQEDHTVWCARHAFDPTIPIVMLVGRLTALKGADLLWDAIKTLDIPWQLLLIGEGNSDNKIWSKIHAESDKLGVNTRLRWLGHQENMTDFYRHADLLVCASRQPEAFGRTVIEAAACGVPAIVPDKGGTAEIVIDEVTGWHYALGKVNSLRKKLETALKFPIKQRQQFGQKAKERVQQNYTLDIMQRKTIDLYQTMLKNAENH